MPRGLPSELVLLPGARNVRYDIEGDGSASIAYDVKLAFPATPLFEAASRALSRPVWEPLDELWLNPGTPSSHTTGWTAYPDGRHYWLGQWKSLDGRLATYVLQYASAKPDGGDVLSRPDNAKLRVDAMMFSSAFVSAVEKDKSIIGRGSQERQLLPWAVPDATWRSHHGASGGFADIQQASPHAGDR